MQTYDKKPRRRLWELMKSQGMQENQAVLFMSDCGESFAKPKVGLTKESPTVSAQQYLTVPEAPPEAHISVPSRAYAKRLPEAPADVLGGCRSSMRSACPALNRGLAPVR